MYVCLFAFVHLVAISPLAPGHYHPEHCKLDSSPAYSFGLKTLPMPPIPGMYRILLSCTYIILRLAGAGYAILCRELKMRECLNRNRSVPMFFSRRIKLDFVCVLCISCLCFVHTHDSSSHILGALAYAYIHSRIPVYTRT